jgi:hypothetical protein
MGDASCINDPLKRRAEFAIAIVHQILTCGEAAPLLHGDVARDLHHPGAIGIRGHPRHMHLAAPHMDKEQHIVRHETT